MLAKEKKEWVETIETIAWHYMVSGVGPFLGRVWFWGVYGIVVGCAFVSVTLHLNKLTSRNDIPFKTLYRYTHTHTHPQP